VMDSEVPFTNLLRCNHHWPFLPCTDADPSHADEPHVDIHHNEDPHDFISGYPGAELLQRIGRPQRGPGAVVRGNLGRAGRA